MEQIECADFIVLNKKDKCSDEQMETLTGIAGNINPSAQVVQAEWGKVPLETVFGAPKGSSWVCKADDEDDLRDAVAAAKQLSKKRKVSEAGASAGGHGHGHSHGHAHEHGHTADCSDCKTEGQPISRQRHRQVYRNRCHCRPRQSAFEASPRH